MISYFNELGVSQSFLKGVLKNSFKKEDSASLQRGTLVDHFLFGGKDLPSFDGKINKYCEIAMLCSDLEYSTILAKVREEQYNPSYKDETHLANIAKIQDFLDYFKDNKGKVYTTQEIELSKKQAEYIRESVFYKFLEGEENLFQAPLYGEYMNIRLKGLIDWVSVNHTNKTIKLIDLKTSHYSKPDMFPLSCKEYRYDFQMAFYKELVEQNYPGYTVECYWLAYNFKKVFLWRVSDTDLIIGRKGITKIFAEYEEHDLTSKFFIHGWETALEIYRKAIDNEYPDYDVSYYESKGFFKDSIYA